MTCSYYPYCKCEKEATHGEYCEKHSKVICDVCGKQATHNCSYEGKYLACGAPLCDEHTGFTYEDDNMHLVHMHH